MSTPKLADPTIKIPASLAACADRLYKIKTELKPKAQAAVDQLDAERIAIEAHLINELPKDDATGITGKRARVTIVVKDVPQLVDFEKLKAWIKRTGSWDVLTRRLSSKAIEDTWDEGKNVPGVDKFLKATVSLNKV